MKPELQFANGIFSFKFIPEHLSIKIDRIREKSRTTTGEITVRDTTPGVAPHLHQARLNLMSTSARKQISKHLLERRNNLDWDAIVEQVCVLCVNALREGEPVSEIGDIYLPSGNRYRLWPFIPDEKISLIYGDGGTGKSTLALYFAILIHDGFEHAGFKPAQGNVLFLDYEENEIFTNNRIYEIKEGLSIKHSLQVHYRHSSRPLIDEVAELQQIIIDRDIKLLIVDSIGMATGGEPESAEHSIAMLRALRSLKITCFLIDHVAKKQEGRTTPFGSVYKFNESRSIWEVKKYQTPGDDDLTIGLYHRKSNFGKLSLPIGFEIQYFANKIIISKTDIKEKLEAQQDIPLSLRIYEELKAGSLTVKQLSENLETSEDSARKTLNRGKDKKFIKIGDSWGLLQSQ